MLLVITDGDDDASRKRSTDTMKAAERIERGDLRDRRFQRRRPQARQEDGAPLEESTDGAAEATGGLAYFPETLDEVAPVCEQVARDIRNQYTLGYYPTNAREGRHVPHRASRRAAAKGTQQARRPHPHRLLRAEDSRLPAGTFTAQARQRRD